MNLITRELRVAFSPRVQPVWVRVVKWVVILALATWLWRTPYFWPVLGGLLTLALSVHFFYRWKTKGWTQPWGGWNDA